MCPDTYFVWYSTGTSRPEEGFFEMLPSTFVLAALRLSTSNLRSKYAQRLFSTGTPHLTSTVRSPNKGIHQVRAYHVSSIRCNAYR